MAMSRSVVAFKRLVQEYAKNFSTDYQSGEFNPLSPGIKRHILLTVLHTFLIKLVRRICLNIKTSYRS